MEYTDVETWDDLIQTNIDFFEEIRDETFYYGGKWKDECYDNGMFKIEADILRLHREYKIFTHNGQENSYKNEQRSYLNFACPQYLANSLMAKLLLDDRVYVCAYCVNKEMYWHNFEDEKYVLTYKKGIPFSRSNLHLFKVINPEIISLADTDEYESIYNLLCEAVCFHVAIRGFPDKEDHELSEAITCVIEALN